MLFLIPILLNYTAEFEARSKIIVGKNDFSNPNQSLYTINNYNNFLTPDGDFKVTNNGKAIMHCGTEIDLNPGFSVDLGSELDAYIQPYTWPNDAFRLSHGLSESKGPNYNTKSNIPLKQINTIAEKLPYKIYPNPSQGQLTIEKGLDFVNFNLYDINGKKLYEKKLIQENTLDLNFLSSGVYLIELINNNGTKYFFKWLITN